jgi:hypothetical protein
MTGSAAASKILPPREPFHFNASAHLLRITEYKADNLTDFLQQLRQCPEGSIFQHSFRTLQEHHFIREGFSNDFAQWAESECNQPELAEELAGVDVRDFTSLTELREEFVHIMENFLQQSPEQGSQPARRSFYFCASDIVVIPTNFTARSLQEFAEYLKKVSLRSIHHHFIEARLRLKLMSNDFSYWLREDLGLAGAADQLNRIDIYTSTLEDVRQQIARVVERAAA